MCIYIYIYIYTTMYMYMYIYIYIVSSWRLPDGVRTNRVVEEAARFPIIKCHEKTWTKYGETLQHVATCAPRAQNIAKCTGFVSLL